MEKTFTVTWTEPAEGGPDGSDPSLGPDGLRLIAITTAAGTSWFYVPDDNFNKAAAVATTWRDLGQPAS